MAAINDLIAQIENPELRARIQTELERMNKQKKFGLVFEEHLPESVKLYDVPVKKSSVVMEKAGGRNVYKVLSITEGVAECVDKGSQETKSFNVSDLVVIAEFGTPIYPYLKPIDSICNAPDSDLWHTLIEADNYHALQLLEYLYAGKVDCIYIDPPYNTGARDWKYNNDYVDGADEYRHSKWLSFMQRRLSLAKKLLNPKDSVLIITIDEKEYLHLGCLLEQMFPDARIQMVSCCINPAGVARANEFSRSDEYIYFVKFGTAGPTPVELSDDWLGSVQNTSKKKALWASLLRTGTNNMREDRPNLFYPIFVSEDGKKFLGAGFPIALYEDKTKVEIPKGARAIWPIHLDGTEGCWQIGRDTLLDLQSKHFVRLGGFTDRGMAISYLKSGEQKKVESGIYKIGGINEDGSYELDYTDYKPTFIPWTQWMIPLHDASRHGSGLLRKIFKEKIFDFPKSLYAVYDSIRFFVDKKPNALVLDFFAGSGTTLHAIALLNALDGGNRRCVLVTNNEVSEEDARVLSSKGIERGEQDWEKYGIAQSVTWPRVKCSIQGTDINGDPIQGDYVNCGRPMSAGFKANAIFFKLGFLNKNAVALGRQFCELLPVLWMKAGAIGKCPELTSDVLPEWLILPENKMSILIDDNQYLAFKEEMEKNPGIETLYIITDFEREYAIMADELGIPNTFQLYRDYLDNFRINHSR